MRRRKSSPTSFISMQMNVKSLSITDANVCLNSIGMVIGDWGQIRTIVEGKEITETLQKHAHKPPSYTYIVFEEVKMEDWAIGGSLLG